jgi:hypothetical protein
MHEQPTCGQGLAVHSALPAKLGDLIASVAAVLEIHTAALHLDDENAKTERNVYLKLVAEHRQAAADLHAIAEEMRGYRDLPMARHDPQVLSAPAATDAFEGFVTIEEALLSLLQSRLGRDREMLGEARRMASAR